MGRPVISVVPFWESLEIPRVPIVYHPKRMKLVGKSDVLFEEGGYASPVFSEYETEVKMRLV